MEALVSAVNHRFVLAERPVGLPTRSAWNYLEEPVREPAENEIGVRILYISLDPAMRGWMVDRRSYIPPVQIGEVMRALGLGRVVASRNPKFAVGDYVYGALGVQEYAVNNGSGMRRVDPKAAPLTVYLSALGMPGMTAYFGLVDIGKPQPGETLVISGAAGAVGALVGQIGKIHGCRVIGIAGGPEKCKYLKDLGFDVAIDYKAAGNIYRALQEHCPKGLDIYFDNVGGDMLEAALALLAKKARVVICGAISGYNATTPPKGPANYLSLLVNNASMTGFTIGDYVPRWGEALAQLAAWYASGQLKSREHVVEGIEKFPETLLMLFSGENHGKLVLKVADP